MRISDWSQTVLFRSIDDVRARLALALQQVATDDGEADADRPEVLLRSAVDHAETAPVHGLGRDRGAEIGDQRPIPHLRDVEIGRASTWDRGCQYVKDLVVAGALHKKISHI